MAESSTGDDQQAVTYWIRPSKHWYRRNHHRGEGDERTRTLPVDEIKSLSDPLLRAALAEQHERNLSGDEQFTLPVATEAGRLTICYSIPRYAIEL